MFQLIRCPDSLGEQKSALAIKPTILALQLFERASLTVGAGGTESLLARAQSTPRAFGTGLHVSL